MNRRFSLDRALSFLLLIPSALFLFPILIVLINSFKGQFYIADAPFTLPNAQTFAGFTNYISGMQKTGFLQAFGWSLLITVGSVWVIVLFTSMTAWYIVRLKSAWSTLLYNLFVTSMVVPFQMVMFSS